MGVLVMKLWCLPLLFLLAGAAHAQDGELHVRFNDSNLRGVVDAKGQIVVPFKYQSIEHYRDKKRFLVSINVGENAWRMGILDETGKVVVPVVYDRLQRISNNGDEDTHLAQRDGKWGYVDIMTGEVLIAPKYAGLSIDSLSTDEKGRGIAIAHNGEKWGVINTSDKVLVPFEFDEIITSSYDSIQMLRKNAVVSLRFDGQHFLGETVECEECGRFTSDATRRSAASEPATSFGGIGVAINRLNPEDKTVWLVDVMIDGPAAQAGLKPDDEILSVEGKPVSAMTLEQVREALRGEAGSRVRLMVRRRGESKEFSVERQVINLR